VSGDEFNELVKRKFAEFERKNGRVPTLQELADLLDVDSRILARKLKRAIKTLGIDNFTEGTSAFKSTLRKYLSGDILMHGAPGFADLSSLLLEAKTQNLPYSELRWYSKDVEYRLSVSKYSYSDLLWALFSSKNGFLFKRITREIGDICCLLQSLANEEEIDGRLIKHVSGEPVVVNEDCSLPQHKYEEPISDENLPPNVLPFRKPYQHSDE